LILFFVKTFLQNSFVLGIFTLNHDVDSNNNSKNFYVDEDLYDQKMVHTDAQRNFLDMSYVKIAEQLTIIDAVCLGK
jgi:hypothetical protein